MTEPGSPFPIIVGDRYVDILPLTFDRSRIVVGHARDVDVMYDDGW